MQSFLENDSRGAGKIKKRPLEKQRAAARKIVHAVIPERTAPHPHLSGGIAIFIESALVLQAVLLLLHFMIYRTIDAAFGIGGLGFAIILGLLSLTFILAAILSATTKGLWVRIYYKFAAIWFAFVAPLCGACFAFVIIENIFPYIGVSLMPFAAGAICFGSAIAITLYGIWNSTRARLTRVALHLPNTPESWKGKKAVFVSDFQLGNVYGPRFVKKVVKKINSVAPEVVFIGGDLYDGVRCDADELIAPLKSLHPPLGIYFITGNHEYIRDNESYIDAIAKLGIIILDNEKIELDGMQLIGVDYCDVATKESFATILEELGIEKDKPSILLKHVPDQLDVAERFGISLTVSGHTHQGQFFPLSYVTSYIYKGYDYGLKRFENMLVYTSSGVGTWMSPFRIGTKSEVVVFEFE